MFNNTDCVVGQNVDRDWSGSVTSKYFQYHLTVVFRSQISLKYTALEHFQRHSRHSQRQIAHTPFNIATPAALKVS